MSLTPGPSAASPFWPASQLLSVIVGDGVSSRMYWDLVDPGYVDSAQLGYYDFDGSGAYLTYLCSDPGSTEENRALIRAIYDDVNKNGVTETEVAQAKSKVASQIVLSSERPRGRRAVLGENWLYRHQYRSIDDDLQAVLSLTLKDFRDLLDAYPLGETTTVAVGPLALLNGA
jgi:predicted Zn-dependent peptidase